MLSGFALGLTLQNPCTCYCTHSTSTFTNYHHPYTLHHKDSYPATSPNLHKPHITGWDEPPVFPIYYK